MSDQTPSRRFFAPQLGADIAQLDETEAHHLLHVLRLKPGQRVELFDGKGQTAIGLIETAKRSKVEIAIESRNVCPQPTGPKIHLQFAVPKGKRLDWLIEKATELGASSLTPVLFQRSVAGGKENSGSKLHKWQIHCVSAAKQSGLNFLPDIHSPTPLAELLANPQPNSLNLLGDLGPQTLSIPQALNQIQQGQDVSLLIGPEGGMTEAEHSLAVQSGYVCVRIGDTILRIETAVIALLAAVRAICG